MQCALLLWYFFLIKIWSVTCCWHVYITSMYYFVMSCHRFKTIITCLLTLTNFVANYGIYASFKVTTFCTCFDVQPSSEAVSWSPLSPRSPLHYLQNQWKLLGDVNQQHFKCFFLNVTFAVLHCLHSRNIQFHRQV